LPTRCAWLLSDASSYVTGEIVVVDGGRMTAELHGWWVRGSDLIALKNNKLLLTPAGLTNSSYLLSKSDLAADVAGSFVANKNATYNGPNAGWSQPTQLDTSSNERFVAVRFDKDGNILGTSDYISSFSAPVNNSAVHRTCWASFSGLTIQQLS
jgi:hypothetical protein